MPTVQAIQIVQPLGTFYVAALPAEVLLQVAFSRPLQTVPGRSNDTYSVEGSQRPLSPEKLKEIKSYIETVEAAFPNSIILTANYRPDGELERDQDKRWRIQPAPCHNGFLLTIPTMERLATVIDGQHRLFGFRDAPARLQAMPMLCSIYFDLPHPFQAYLFATINFNQKKVDRSLAYELFGYDLEDDPPTAWSPEKLAVFICRKINTESESPLRGRVLVSAIDDGSVYPDFVSDQPRRSISTATVVDGVLSLISNKPMRDKSAMHTKSLKEGRSREMVRSEPDPSPLREYFVKVDDVVIYTAVRNYFAAVESALWASASERSMITRNVGVQALFEILKIILADIKVRKDISVGYLCPSGKAA